MKRLFYLVLVLVTYFGYSQKYEFHYLGVEQNIDPEIEKVDHFLGEEIGQKMEMLKENYTYKTYNEVRGTYTPHVEKPTIYYSIKKANKYYKKYVKKGKLDIDKVQEKFEKMLVVALNIRSQNTIALEEQLQEIKNPEKIVNLFADEVILL